VKELPAKDAFLDSSVLLSRKFGLAKQKTKIRIKLKNRKRISSKYAKTEIKRTFLKDAIWLHSLIVEEGNLLPIYDRISEYPTTQRRKDRCIKILKSVSDKGNLRYADTLARLENLILGIEKEVLRGVQIIESGTKCQLAEEELEFNYPYFDIKHSCTQQTAICSLPAYLAQNMKVLHVLKTGISGIPHLRKLEQALDILLQDPKKAKGNRCKTLGDTIICLDAPKDCDIFSTNEKDFDPISKHLGKSFVSAR